MTRHSDHEHAHADHAQPVGVWHEEAHDGILEYASLRLTGGAVSLFVNVGVELDGRFSARVETLGQTDEVTGLIDARAAKRVALERARHIVTELARALDEVVAHEAGQAGTADHPADDPDPAP